MLQKHHWHLTYRWARRIAIALLGGTVLLIGVALIVLPGPALVVIPLGLAILSLEFAWARVWLRRIKARTAQVVEMLRFNSATVHRDDRD